MKSRGIFIIGLLLALGVIFTIIFFYIHVPLISFLIISHAFLAIILTGPKIYEALGIGLVASVLTMLFSTGLPVLPPIWLISGPIGTMIFYGIYTKIKGKTWCPGISTFIGTIVTGFAALLLTNLVSGRQFTNLTLMMSFFIILISAIVEAVENQIIFIEARKRDFIITTKF